MSAELLSLVAAGGSGSAMLAGIAAHQHVSAEKMRASRVKLGTRYPANLEAGQVTAIWSGLAGLPPTTEIVAETAATEGSITHSLWVPQVARESVRAALVGAVPSMRITEAPASPSDHATLSLRLFVAEPTFLLTDNAAGVSRSVLSSMANLRGGEAVSLLWALSSQRARPRPELENPTPRQREIAKAWAAKASQPGFGVAGLILVRAATRGRARELASHIENVLRSRRGLAGGIRVTDSRGNRTLASLPKVRRSSGFLGVSEIAQLLALPQGEVVPGVEVGASRELLVPRHVPREGGRRLFIGRDSSGDRPVALSPEASRVHMAVIAPTGGGKSTLLLHSILSDISGGYGGILLDPKNQLVSDLLDRVPAEHADRIVVLDPSAPGAVPGLDLLGSGDPDTRTEVVLSALRGIYKDAWGVRIDSYLRMGLRTAMELENPIISDWMRLYTEPDLRRAAVARIQNNPILAAQWRTYEDSLSSAEQFQHIAPALSRITSLLARPALRNIINQPQPKLSIPRLLAERKWLLVALSPSALGESANDLLSALVGYLLWTAVESRVNLPEHARHPIFFYCDELQSLKIPVGVEVFLERSRGLGCGVVAATQGLARLPQSVRDSLLGNVGSLVALKATGHDEATRLARELPGLQASDLMGLSSSRYECAARINTGGLGSGSVVVTGRTEAPPPLTGQAARIRALSAQAYGRDPREIEAELVRRMDGDGIEGGDSYGRVGRQT
ncbi:MAG TPA: type IV secretion system DNA-binding domain-containing protein [Solirubrobacteraceae bacterium]|nr:type IV secretion system DNA-binding domain-containing protein [Solirubrobacteraceae bacterium]